jgi:FAD/FMN-containing dehydrogenase
MVTQTRRFSGSSIETVKSGPAASIEQLRYSLVGELITRDSENYEEVRSVHVTTHAGRPGAIVRAAGVSDVVETVRFAKAQGRPLAVRSGGHSIPGYSSVDDSLVVDLSQMRSVSIDPERGIARVQAGATSGDLIEAARPHGLALSTGDTASVGLGGLTTGGGIGFMVRKHGLAIDNLISAQVVTASGDVVTASASEHSDLFWAIRGGGGNFGIITEFEFQLARVGQVLGGLLVLPGTREVIRGYLDYVADAPDDLTTIADLMAAPPAPFIPEDRVGENVLMVFAVWSGSIEDGEAAYAPLRALAQPVADVISPIEYADIYEFTRELEAPHSAALRSMFADSHSDETIDAIVSAVEAAPELGPIVMFRGLGGSVLSAEGDDTAFAHRKRRFFTTVISLWEPGTDGSANVAWVNALYDAIKHEARGVYVNFLGDEGEDRIREAYPPQTYDRLREVKRAYDPANMFCFNQNIRP